MKKILIQFFFAMAIATCLNAQPHIERLKEKHRVDGWSFAGSFAWGYSGLRPNSTWYNHSSVYAFVPYRLPNFPSEGLPAHDFLNSELNMNVLDFSVSVTKGLSKHFRARTNLFYRTRQTNGWNVNTSSGRFENTEWIRTIGVYENTLQVGFETFVMFDFWSNKNGKQLNLLIGGGLRHFSRLSGFEVDGTNDHAQSYQGYAKETYRRTGVAHSFGAGIERVHFFHKNWGYSLGVYYDRIAFKPNRMTKTEFVLDGENRLPDQTTRQTDFRFGDITRDDPQDTNQPKRLPKEDYRFIAVLFRAGICYRL